MQVLDDGSPVQTGAGRFQGAARQPTPPTAAAPPHAPLGPGPGGGHREGTATRSHVEDMRRDNRPTSAPIGRPPCLVTPRRRWLYW